MRCSAPPRWRRARPLASFSSSPTPPLLARQPPFPLSLPLCLIPPRPARPPLHVSSARSPQLEPNDRRLDAAGRSALLWSTSPSSISRAGGQRRLHTRRHVGRLGTARAAAPSPHSHVIIAKVRWSQASGLLFLFPTTAKIGISSYCSMTISCFALLLSLKALVLRVVFVI